MVDGLIQVHQFKTQKMRPILPQACYSNLCQDISTGQWPLWATSQNCNFRQHTIIQMLALVQILGFTDTFFEVLGFSDYDVEPCVGQHSTDWVCPQFNECLPPFLAPTLCRRYVLYPVDRCPTVPSRDPLHYCAAIHFMSRVLNWFPDSRLFRTNCAALIDLTAEVAASGKRDNWGLLVLDCDEKTFKDLTKRQGPLVSTSFD